MDKILINNWNSVIKNNDKIFMLGDFCLAGRDKIIEIGNKLNGRKTLIMGNHEGGALSTYYKAGFEMVSKYPILLDNIFILSHYPIENTIYHNIHGHIHNKELNLLNKEMYHNVSSDVINFTPVNLDEIKRRINNLK